jgi:hypothetical protein
MEPYADSLPPRLLGTAPAVGAVAGIPGKFTPWNAKRPANLAALQAAGALGQVAAWAPGQSVQLRNGSSAHWAGAAWVAGPAPAPVGVAADSRVSAASTQVSAPSGTEAFTGTVPDGTVPVDGDLDEAATVVTADGTEHVGTLPVTAELLTVAAGAPGDYSPALKASDRPRNITELRRRAQPVAPFAWLPGQYVLVGENGKRAHWDGATWQRGTVPDGTVGDA